MINKLKMYKYIIILNIIGFIIICITTYLNMKYLGEHSYLEGIYSTIVSGIGFSILSTIDCNKFNEINRDYKRLHGKSVVTFNQIDEDICQLNDGIGGLYYESGVLYDNLQQLNQRCVDFSSHKTKSLLNSTIDGLWALKMSSRKVSSMTDSRFSDIWLNVNNDNLLEKYYKNKCKRIKNDMEPIRDDVLYLPDKYFDNIFSKDFLKCIIINDRYCNERKELCSILKDIRKDTLNDIDKLLKYRRMISNW